MNILALDSSDLKGSLGFFVSGKIVSSKDYSLKRRFSVHLIEDINDILKEHNLKLNDIDYFAIIIGPGSFTGLRIGLASFKTLAWSLKKTIIPISTMLALAHNIKEQNTLICPIIDAKRKEIYAAGFEYQNGQYKEIIPSNKYTKEDFLKLLNNSSLKNKILVGNKAFITENLENHQIADNESIQLDSLYTISKQMIDENNILLDFNELEPDYKNVGVYIINKQT